MAIIPIEEPGTIIEEKDQRRMAKSKKQAAALRSY